MCDRLCTLVENQEHCVKNGKFLIVSCIEHIMTRWCRFPSLGGDSLDKDLHKADGAKESQEEGRRRRPSNDRCEEEGTAEE